MIASEYGTPQSDRSYRVLFVNASAEAAWGAELCLLNITKQLVTASGSPRYKPIVCVGMPGPLVQQLRASDVPVHVIDFGAPRSRRELRSPIIVWRILSLILGVLRLVSVIRRERIDLVHSNSSAVLAGAVAARLSGTPHIWHVREIVEHPRPLREVLRWLQPSFSARVICISSAVRDHFGGLPMRLAVKLITLHDGVDLTLFNPEEVPSDGRLFGQHVGMVARINPWKGHKLFIESAAMVARVRPDAQFSIVGGCLPAYEPIKRAIVASAHVLGLDGRLCFLGQLRPEQVRDFMAQLDVLVLPSLAPEPFGLVMIEAMAMGKPVIATAHGGPLDVIRHGIDGLLVPPGDPAAIAAAIRMLLDDRSRCLAMGESARRRAFELFSLDKQVTRLTEIYDDLVAR